MSIEDATTIDLLGLASSGDVVLSISNHLSWKPSTLSKLQKKIRLYLSFIQSGEIYQSYPQARDKSIRIHLISTHSPDPEAIAFFKQCEQVVNDAGYQLTHEIST